MQVNLTGSGKDKRVKEPVGTEVVAPLWRDKNVTPPAASPKKKEPEQKEKDPRK
jgi:hypothetical protein